MQMEPNRHDTSATTPVAPWLSLPTLVALMARLGVGLGLRRATINGLVNALVVPRRCAPLERYQPSAADLFVATFAKSGTNWALQMGVQIAHCGAAEFEHIHDLVAWPEVPAPGIVALDDPRPASDAPTGMRVIKTHACADLVSYDAAARYVSVIRDPKEVVVSAYYFILGVFGVRSKVSPSQWYELCVAPDGLVARWIEHSASYWAWRARPNVLVRTFPQLLADPAGAVDELATLMGVTLTDHERDAVIERSSFAYMKRHDHRFGPVRSPLTPPDEHPSMMRKGKSGRSSELLDADQCGHIDALCREGLRQRGCDLPYDELFGA